MPLWRPRVERGDRPLPGRVPIAGKPEDSLLAAIVKWIPVEVVTVYKAAMGAIPEGWPSLRLWMTVGSIVVTFLWIGFATTPAPGRISWRQAILAPIAFTAWAVATQADVMKSLFAEWDPWMALLVLAGGTVLLPILEGILKALGVPQN